MISNFKRIVDGFSKDILGVKSLLDSIVACGEHGKNLVLYPDQKMSIKLFPNTPTSILSNVFKNLINKIKIKR